jgi:predicted DNA-binding protein with PD1-like motif
LAQRLASDGQPPAAGGGSARQQENTTITGDLEITSLAETLASGGAHLHMAITDNTGAVLGALMQACSLVRSLAMMAVVIFTIFRYQALPHSWA